MEGGTAAAGVARPDPRRWLGLAVVLLAAFMDFIDVTIVVIAAPVIQADLGATYAGIQWLLAGYTLPFGLLLITGGRLGDLVGRKRMFLLGVAGFTLASAWCSMAGGIGMLIAARVVQGAAAAMMIPQVLATIQVAFPRAERPKAYGLYGAVAGLAFSAAPIIGGVLVEHDLLGLAWRPIFLINLPVGVLALVAGALLLRESRAEQRTRLDLGGVAIVTVGLLLLLYPLIQGNDLDWPAWTFAMMAGALPALAVFVWYERRQEQREALPLMPLSLFRRRSFLAGLLGAFVVFSAVASFFLVLSLTLQAGHGLSPLATGLIVTPWPIGLAVTAAVASRLASTVGRRLVTVGTVLLTTGMLLLITAIRAAGQDLGAWHLVPGLLAGGLGLGLVAPILVDIALSGVPPRDAGAASGVTNTVMQVGGAAGLAVLGTLFVVLLQGQAAPSIAAVTPQLQRDLAAAGVTAAAQDELLAGFRRCALDRAAQHDQARAPSSCQQAGPAATGAPAPAARAALQRAGGAARERAFGAALERTLRWAAGAFALGFLLSFALPPRARRDEAVTV
jgi:EmrB/QacA subfamily drug resistance transporter